MITAFEIEQGIEAATFEADRFSGSAKFFVASVILPLHDIFQQGLCSDIKCDSESIRHKMNSLEHAINRKFNL